SPLGTLSHKGNGIYSLTFPWVYGGKERVKIYALNNSQTGNSKIEWVTMVKGSVPLTEWVPAHEDLQSSIGKKADSTATEEALNEAAAKLQVLQQEVEAAATTNELNDFIDKYNKDTASR